MNNVLVITGPQGSGKSILVEMIRRAHEGSDRPLLVVDPIELHDHDTLCQLKADMEVVTEAGGVVVLVTNSGLPWDPGLLRRIDSNRIITLAEVRCG